MPRRQLPSAHALRLGDMLCAQQAATCRVCVLGLTGVCAVQGHLSQDEEGKLQIELPPRYTTCVQHLPNNAWLLPSGDFGVWLCARPVHS